MKKHLFYPVKILFSILALSLMVACWGDEPEPPTPPTPVTPVDPNPPTPAKDTNAPTITVSKSSVNIIAGPVVSISGDELKIGDVSVASWKDDKSTSYTVSITFTGKDGTTKAVSSGDKLTEEGKLSLKVTDEAGNSSEAEIALTKTDSQAPTIEVKIAEKNVIAGVKVKVEGNQLFFDDQVAATWKDDYTETCSAQLSLDGQAVNSGDVLQVAGKLIITVSDDFQNKATAEITLLTEAIYGLDGLKSLSLQVDKEVNLLQGITYADGVSLDKVEIEAQGNRVVVQDPSHYVPETPGTIGLIITVKAGSKTLEYRVDNLEVKGLDYTAPEMKTADIIQERYPWYNNLQQSTRDFIYPHLLASYAACNHSKQENRVHIIMGENPDASDVENIWQFNDPSEHAYEGYYRVRALAPDTPIKGCNDYWSNLEVYLDQHPNEFYTIGVAASSLGGGSQEELISNTEYAPHKRVLENKNVIVVCGIGNWAQGGWKIFNEDEKDGNRYTASSPNSNYFNKISVSGYNSWGDNNYYSPRYSVYGGLKTAMPVGFKKDKRNLVMPMIPLIASNNTESQNTDASFPTSVASAVVWNAVSIVLSIHPGITPVDAMTIIVKNYLREEKFQYKDETTNWELVDGGSWYFINIRKLMENEILQADKQPPLSSNCGLVNLPDGPGIYYEGPGVLFTVDGSTYDMTEENRAVFESAIQSGKEIKWSYNSDRAKKYGVSSIKAGVMDKSARLIPDLSLTIQVN